MTHADQKLRIAQRITSYLEHVQALLHGRQQTPTSISMMHLTIAVHGCTWGRHPHTLRYLCRRSTLCQEKKPHYINKIPEKQCASNASGSGYRWMQAESGLVVELEQYQSDLQVRLALQNGQVEAPDSQPLTDQSELLLLDRFAISLQHW